MVYGMKLSSIRYLLREGFRNIWQNRFMAIASVGVLVSCLLLTGGAYLFFVNVDHAFEWVYGQNVVVVFVKDDCSEAQTTALGEKLKAVTNVSDVEFVSKEETLEKLAGSLSEAVFEEYRQNNPMQDSYVVTFSDLSKLDATVAQIETIPEVDKPVSYSGDIARTLTKVRGVVLAVGGWIIGMLLLVSLFIIANTIKLTVYSRRLEIYIMKSVGATNSFVRIPFIIEGIVLGLVAGGISYGLIYLIYSRLASMFTSTSLMFGLVAFGDVWWQLLAGFLCAGVLTGMLGSAISMRKYLKNGGSLGE